MKDDAAGRRAEARHFIEDDEVEAVEEASIRDGDGFIDVQDADIAPLRRGGGDGGAAVDGLADVAEDLCDERVVDGDVEERRLRHESLKANERLQGEFRFAEARVKGHCAAAGAVANFVRDVDVGEQIVEDERLDGRRREVGAQGKRLREAVVEGREPLVRERRNRVGAEECGEAKARKAKVLDVADRDETVEWYAFRGA